MINNQDNKVKFPQGRTAFIIIHGVGEQIPYETVDYFAQNLIKHYQGQSLPIKLEHLIAKRRLANGNPWIESFVRVSSAELQPDDFIDIHEYYWAADTENKISVPEVLQWTEQTLQGTIAFYSREENQDKLDEILKENKWKKFFKYRLRWLTIFLRLFNIVYPWLRLIVCILLLLLNPFLHGQFLQPAWKLSRKLVTPLLVNFVGDVAIYTTTNVKSPYHKIRGQILAESLALLKAILKDKEANYDQVIIAGHSLGSCIAYDTLNLLCIEASLSKDKGKSLLVDKITGLITFASPLDKIAFFLREMAQQHQYIRQRILEHLNSFRVKPLYIQITPYLTKNPVECQLEKVRWVNYYHLQDPISGHLDYYNSLDNVLLEYETSWGEKAHLGYWTDPNFYKDIAQRFLETKNE
ncbi:hypothetical protein NIES592_10935 [Fischerella major NIES-592]|uniref:Uncharacterized protein n=2 Tax=Fischerella TaxID=1190 RepID=A0A1U7GZ79_9CYAN|nr:MULTISPECIES: hypothetical protein [Fischerella]OKH13852.1 hypothetical protein NIES592_10935 [Fischerella major NIES-592]PMB42443.1 hypothetical protein CEN41_15205 [Fischerella thermalis CCMEE 5330]